MTSSPNYQFTLSPNHHSTNQPFHQITLSPNHYFIKIAESLFHQFTTSKITISPSHQITISMNHCFIKSLFHKITESLLISQSHIQNWEFVNPRFTNSQYLQLNYCFDFFNDSENTFLGFFEI